MAQVRVWNDNVHPYKEHFKEQDIHIKPKSFIVMDEGDAKLFKGTYAPMTFDGDGNPTAQGFKMIRIEAIPGGVADPAPKPEKEHLCQACGYEGASAKDLSEHCDSTHSSERVVDEEAEREVARRKKSKAG